MGSSPAYGGGGRGSEGTDAGQDIMSGLCSIYRSNHRPLNLSTQKVKELRAHTYRVVYIANSHGQRSAYYDHGIAAS